MKYSIFFIWWLCLAGTASGAEETAAQGVEASPRWSWPDKEIDMQCLRESYPEYVAGMEDDAMGTWLVLRDGSRVLYAVPPNSSPEALSPAATLRQSMEQRYPLEPARPVPAAGEHPGRVRSQDFLAAVYGRDKARVRAQLQAVSLVGRSVLFSSAAGSGEALRRVAGELEALLRQSPMLRVWVLPLGGTFLWRRVAGEERLSPHSFGVAVDLSPSRGAYWRWSGGTSHPAQSTYPTEIVKIFEKNGFVWGGKWREYDLMHFEYRPEIVCKARKALKGTAARQGGEKTPHVSPSP